MAVGHGRDALRPGFPRSFISGLSSSDKHAFDHCEIERKADIHLVRCHIMRAARPYLIDEIIKLSQYMGCFNCQNVIRLWLLGNGKTKNFNLVW